MEDFLNNLSNFFRDIIDTLLNFLYFVIDFLFGWIFIPQMPDNLVRSINSFLDLIFENLSLFGFFIRPSTLKIIIPLIIFVFSFKYIYKVVIFFVKKMPFINMK